MKTDKNPWYDVDFVIAPYDERIVRRKGITVKGEIMGLKNRK